MHFSTSALKLLKIIAWKLLNEIWVCSTSPLYIPENTWKLWEGKSDKNYSFHLFTLIIVHLFVLTFLQSLVRVFLIY